MTTTSADTAADRALKAKHRALWASGDYPALAADLIAELGPVLVSAAGIRTGDVVLDVAAGAGNVAIPAAETGARVVASDLTPELLESGRRLAAQRGVELTWRTDDAEALPDEDATYDAVLSCLGVMFAPHHQAVADELVRVCRPRGTIGLIAWTPRGFVGQLFATMKPYAPPPPPGVQPPPLWGDEAYVRNLLGDRVDSVRTELRTVRIDRFATAEDFRDYFKARYGPTIAVYRWVAEQDPDRVAALDADLVDLARRFDRATGPLQLDWEYLLLTASRRP